MSDHTRLLAASLRSRSAYEAVAESEEDWPDEHRPTWAAMARFYATDKDAQTCDPDIVAGYASEGVSNPKHAKSRAEGVKRLWEMEVSAPNVRSLVLQAKLGKVSDEAAIALASRAPTEAVATLWEKWHQTVGELSNVDSPPLTNDWGAALRRRVDPGQRLVVTPRALNARIGGGLLPKHNVFIFGRPESGKSAFALTMGCGFARRGHRVLYCSNEDPLEDLMARALSCATGKTASDLAEDPEAAIDAGIERGLKNLLMVEMSPGTLAEVEGYTKKYKPDVVVVDQFRNLEGKKGKNDNYAHTLDLLAQGIRQIGKRHNLVTISTTQGADSAEGKACLTMHDIADSKVGVPGAGDLVIGIGVTETLYRSGLRGVSICKNKLTGSHDYFTVRLDAATSRVSSDG